MREGLRCTRRRTGVELGEFDGHAEGRRIDMHWETYGSSKYVSLMDWQPVGQEDGDALGSKYDVLSNGEGW